VERVVVLPYLYHNLAFVDRHVLPDLVDAGFRLVEDARVFTGNVGVYRQAAAGMAYGIANDGRVVTVECRQSELVGVVFTPLEVYKTYLLGGKPGQRPQ
jgi:hypothetical protein